MPALPLKERTAPPGNPSLLWKARSHRFSLLTRDILQSVAKMPPDMAKRSTFTLAQLRRILKAAEGRRIIIRPDGTIIVDGRNEQQTEPFEREREVVL